MIKEINQLKSTYISVNTFWAFAHIQPLCVHRCSSQNAFSPSSVLATDSTASAKGVDTAACVLTCMFIVCFFVAMTEDHGDNDEAGARMSHSVGMYQVCAPILMLAKY